ncbi:tetratricopeptide repeat protein [Candidatus Eisenbacteria bacterium]|uniref:Tetratricopeptide repeat protein n=1 Tax=Eiseniibacteriota bacterium TaxID=2212470 RepID=A0ABV6YIC1_UNCEI
MQSRYLIGTGSLAVVLAAALVVGAAQGQDPFAGATEQIMAGNYPTALEEYQSYIADHPNDRLAPVAAMAAGNLQHLALEDPAGAIKAYERVLKDYRASSWATEAARRKAECLETLEDWAGAGEAYQLALKLASTGRLEPPAGVSAGGGHEGAGVSAAWINEVSLAAANSFYQSGDRQKVIQTYESALRGALPSEASATTLQRLADCYESAGETEKAADRYVRLLQNYPLSPEYAVALSKRPLIEQHRQLDWGPYESFQQATVADRGGNLDEALGLCDQILAGDTSQMIRTSTEYRKILCESRLEGNFTSGLDRLQSLFERSPEARSIPNTEQLITFMTAVSEMEQQVSRSPRDATLMMNLGEMYRRGRANNKAVETLERAVAIEPENGEALLALGHAYAGAGRTEEARDAYKRYLQIDPNDTTALNMIGYMYLGQGNAEEAIPYFVRYAEIAPDDPNAHDSLGEGYMSAGRLQEAVSEYEKALELNPSFANSLFMMGQIHQQLKDKPKAVTAYRQFLELTPSGPQADQARAALEELGGN